MAEEQRDLVAVKVAFAGGTGAVSLTGEEAWPTDKPRRTFAEAGYTDGATIDVMMVEANDSSKFEVHRQAIYTTAAGGSIARSSGTLIAGSNSVSLVSFAAADLIVMDVFTAAGRMAGLARIDALEAAPPSHTHVATEISDSTADGRGVLTAADANPFTDAEQIKLTGIETAATADQVWGEIVGTLSAQTDLQSALDAKAPTASPTLTGTVTVPDGSFAIAKTSGLQGALDAKASTDHDAEHVTGGGDKIRDATASVDGLMTAAFAGKLDGIESGATADQSDAEIEIAYGNQVAVVGQAEAEAGVATTVRRWTAERDGQAIAALAPAVTLAGTPNYITIAGQAITRALINLATHVTGTLLVGNGGTGATTHTSGALLTGAGTGAVTTTAIPAGGLAGLTATQTLTGKTIAFASNTLTNVMSLTTAQSITAGIKKTFQADATNAGLRLAGVTADPSTLVAGDFWFRTDTEQVRYRGTSAARALVTEGLAQILTNKTLGATVMSGALDLGGQLAHSNLVSVVTGVSGTLTTAAHMGRMIVTTGNITVPTTTGFHCFVKFGGAHTVTFNGTVSAAAATGQVASIMVQSATVIAMSPPVTPATFT